MAAPNQKRKHGSTSQWDALKSATGSIGGVCAEGAPQGGGGLTVQNQDLLAGPMHGEPKTGTIVINS